MPKNLITTENEVVEIRSVFNQNVAKTSQVNVVGYFTCVGWQVTLCDPVWQVTSRSSEMGFP